MTGAKLKLCGFAH